MTPTNMRDMSLIIDRLSPSRLFARMHDTYHSSQKWESWLLKLFSFPVKIVTLPLTTSQLESTTKMQKLTPLQKRIQERYVDDEPTKNKMLSQLFQAANVNPLAGCFPALIQIPIFISLYRALQNLIAENKLDEPFLWIPGKLMINFYFFSLQSAHLAIPL